MGKLPYPKINGPMSWVVDLNLAYIISFGLESELSDFVLLGDGLPLLFHLLCFSVELRKLKFGLGLSFRALWFVFPIFAHFDHLVVVF